MLHRPLRSQTHGAFYTLPLADAYGYENPYTQQIGTFGTGNKAGTYLLLPPGFKGDIPAKYKGKTFQATTLFLSSLLRV